MGLKGVDQRRFPAIRRCGWNREDREGFSSAEEEEGWVDRAKRGAGDRIVIL